MSDIIFQFIFSRQDLNKSFKTIPDNAPSKTYVVIGAGITGLFSAIELSHYVGKSDKIIIVEAQNQAGGRIRSEHNGFSMPVNKCATWFHSPIGGSILKRFADLYKVKYFPYKNDGIHAATFDTTLNRKDIRLSTDEDDQILNSVSDIIYDYDTMNFINLAKKGLEKNYDGKYLSGFDIVEEYEKNYGPLPYQVKWNFLFEHSTLGAYADTISTAEYIDENEYNDFKPYQFHPELTGQDLYVEDFQRIPLEIAKLLEQRNITFYYNHFVTNIDYAAHNPSQKPVQITCSNDLTIQSDFCIVTVSAGVLKKNHISFTPQLPTSYQDALNRINMGSFTKVILEFNSLPDISELKTLVEFQHIDKQHIDDNMASFYFANLYPDTGKPILYAIANGEYGKKLEGYIQKFGYEKGSDLAKNEALNCLKKIFNVQNELPSLKHYFVTQPGNNKFFEGAWSYLAPGGTKKDRYQLSQPINNKIAFAGEHTNAHHYAQDVIASIHEGIEAANEAIVATHNVPKNHFLVENSEIKVELPIVVTYKNSYSGHFSITEKQSSTKKYANLFSCTVSVSPNIITFNIDEKNNTLTLSSNNNSTKIVADKDPYSNQLYYDEENEEYKNYESTLEGYWIIEPYLVKNEKGDTVKVKTTLQFSQDKNLQITNIISKPYGCDFIK